MDHKLSKHFGELETQAEAVMNSKRSSFNEFYGQNTENVDVNLLLAWIVRASHLLTMACGKDSQHFKEFAVISKQSNWSTNVTQLAQLRSIFLAAKQDFEGGYFISVRNLIQAEVFSTELDQSRELLRAGYHVAAAVICRVVLETNLITLCKTYSIGPGKLEQMNADLAKAGQYNSLVQKRVTALAAVGNSAAHGKVDEFTASDVDSMIPEVEKLIADWLT
jgi:chromosome condensin MukBEF ATPase and DNA-binding subunit MukB